jgi:signal peptidase I
MTATNPDSQRPSVVNAAFYIILILGVLSLIAIPWNPGGVIQAPLYLIAAWGIRRERAWSAYGLALLTLVLTAVLFAGGVQREQGLGNARALNLGVAVALSLALVILLFWAERAMDRHYSRRSMAWPWITGSVFTCGFFLLFGLFQTPTGSMENTLLIGDRIVVWKTHSKVPARGDIVVHVYPANRKETFIKRVVALPGDRVRIVNKQLFINGSAVSEPYVEHKTSYVDSYRDNFPSEANLQLYPPAREMLANNVVNGEVVVPPHRYFVLGDNRDSSLDSRYWGFIEQSDIIGTPGFIYYSVVPENPAGAQGYLPIVHVRWARLFKTVA